MLPFSSLPFPGKTRSSPEAPRRLLSRARRGALFALALGALCAGPLSAAVPAAPTIPLAEIEPGDTGEWRTAVGPGRVESFPLEVVGVLEDFAGPQLPVLLCRATDALNTMTGPVSGMSGSPVYIDGRLAGAYAYGFPWSKDKTLIGVTPIAAMEELYDLPDLPLREAGEAGGPGGGSRSTAARFPAPALPAEAPTGSGGLQPASLPLSLAASGLSPAARARVNPWWKRRGWSLEGGAAGQDSAIQSSYGAGEPLAVLLAAGDITMGGVGTITARRGNRVIAFGHPMFGNGSTELPVGPAEVVDVVSNYRNSFKIANFGGIEGTLWQDDRPGIQAEIGRRPYVVPVEVRFGDGEDEVLHGDIAEHREILPGMLLAYLSQALEARPEKYDRSLVEAELTVTLEGREEPLHFRRLGPGAGSDLPSMVGLGQPEAGIFSDPLFYLTDLFQQVLRGTETFPRVTGLQADLRVRPGEPQEALEEVRLDSARLRPGESVGVHLRTRGADGSERVRRVEVPIPGGPPGTTFRLRVGNADQLNENRLLRAGYPGRSLEALLGELEDLRPNGFLYLQLLRPSPGLRLEGQRLEGLPPSVLRLSSSAQRVNGEDLLREEVVWETRLPVEGLLTGNAELLLPTES